MCCDGILTSKHTFLVYSDNKNSDKVGADIIFFCSIEACIASAAINFLSVRFSFLSLV